MFETQCTHKACRKDGITPVLDLKDNEIYCPACNQILSHLSPFIKAQLKQAKQIRQPVKQQYSFTCVGCQNAAVPILKDDKLVCASCKLEYKNISKHFEPLIKDHIKKAKQEN